MWDAAWNIIANCNNLAQQVENEDTLLFYDRTHERDMIFAEAIALRAYMHFDLLRIYAPSLLMNPGERTFIPYVDKYPSIIFIFPLLKPEELVEAANHFFDSTTSITFLASA